MAKVSVSIPDELLERAQALHQQDNVSQLVQKGLALLAPEKKQPYRPEWAKAGLAEVADRLRAAAREDYEEGYRAGFELAKVAPWDWLVWLASWRFDLKRVLSIHRKARYDNDYSAFQEIAAAQRSAPGWSGDWYQSLAEAFPAEFAEPGSEDCLERSGQFLAGAMQALRDVWDYANQPIGQ
ncbi:hypothetical protein HUT16_27320 [Kitasatospora sp. NA04385]|uniref:type II toxin-antitoxin system CcdA family antitoxin n=1 Tax=Kitasatospora sp. NA04385 TaxID=2742135 RepID=UPI0015918068|nr:type II toxin-antitoxin system CcdA family antitoxin [Kitasatospora sp. NA04385]QKW22291.1 hypothetical protein HUT16_27320 [Kitasatospora sp. NA04385]